MLDLNTKFGRFTKKYLKSEYFVFKELWTTQKYRVKQEELGWKFLKDELKKHN